MKQISFVSILLFLFFVFPLRIFAASLTLSSDQTSLGINDELSVNVNLNINTSDGTNYYLRGEFYQPGTKSYCGFTWNGSNWFNGPYSGDAHKNLLAVTVTDNTWTGTVKAKADPNDSGCKMSGTYSIRIVRYTTSSDTPSSSDTVNDLSIALVVPTSTPTPAPTAKPITVPTTTKAPAATKLPTQGTSKIVSSGNTIATFPTASHKVVSSEILGDTDVASGTTDASASAYPTVILEHPTESITRSPKAEVLGTSRNLFPMIAFIVLGIFSLICGILTVVIRKIRGI